VFGLVDKSVLVREEDFLGIRYRLPESLREYGRDRLAESGEGAVAHRRHCDFYRRLCSDARDQLFGPDEVALLTRLKLENPNLRSALDHCFAEPGLAADGLQMAADLRNHWLSGHLGEDASGSSRAWPRTAHRMRHVAVRWWSTAGWRSSTTRPAWPTRCWTRLRRSAKACGMP
jgi:predicted ATPase